MPSDEALLRAAAEAAFGSDFTLEPRSSRNAADVDRLYDYKDIADALLPAMRGRNCLYNATFAKTSTTFVAVNAGGVLGGCTFRLIRTGDCVVADVITYVFL